jgi:hypothetical protein
MPRDNQGETLDFSRPGSRNGANGIDGILGNVVVGQAIFVADEEQRIALAASGKSREGCGVDLRLKMLNGNRSA